MMGINKPRENLFYLLLSLSSSMLILKVVLLRLNCYFLLAVTAIGFCKLAELFFLTSRAAFIKNGDPVPASSFPKLYIRDNDRLYAELLLLIDCRHCMKKSLSQASTF